MMGVRKRERNEKEELEVTTDSKSLDSPNIANGFRALFVEFCSESSIHVFRYFAARKRHWSERLWWTVAFVLSTLVCGLLIHDVWIKWNQSPLIVSFAEKTTPVYAIPFPTITICPETKAYKEKFNFTAMYHIMNGNEPPYGATDEEIANMEAISHLCEPHLTEGFAMGTNNTDERIFKIINELAPSFTDTMFFCKYRNEFNLCQNYFKPILTEEGVCFTFNALNSEELYTDKMAPEIMSVSGNPNAKYWSLENGYQKDDGKSYPYRVFGAGARFGLFTLLRLYEADLDYACRGPLQGFKVLFHLPGEVPRVSKHYFRVPLAQEVLVSVRPNMITTSEGLKHYEPNRRQCYFNSERQLLFFKTYTQQNCELECLANYTLRECGCVKFSMPRDRNTPVCGAANIQCYNKAEDKLQRINYLESLTKREYAPKGCNCLPACTAITYDAEISQAKFNYEKVFEAFQNPLTEYPGIQTARLSVYFKEPQFTVSKRSESYGITNLLAIFGGLLSLFLGVSLLSIVEILYFCTIRICRSFRVRQQTLLEPNVVEQFVSNQEPNPIYPDLKHRHHAFIQFEEQ